VSEHHRRCVVCGNDKPTLVLRKDGYSIVRCTACGLMYVGEDPAKIDFDSIYGESYYTGGNDQVFSDYLGEERARRASARRRVWALRLVRARGRLLDVGCAAGFFLAEARDFYDVQGVEFSEFSSRFAREHFGLNVFNGTLLQAGLEASQFDLVTLWDVIEHVPDPDAVLAEAARLLKPDGRLVLTTGDIGSSYARRRGERWHLLAPPWHLYYFSRETMARLGANAGLKMISCRARGVASDHRLMRTRPAIALANLFGRGDIMHAVFARAQS
jgi:2-polyprenyl-3-methyl-5-hydroxy-6-metoxy-1,4-benzoquinol methylase